MDCSFKARDFGSSWVWGEGKTRWPPPWPAQGPQVPGLLMLLVTLLNHDSPGSCVRHSFSSIITRVWVEM